MSKKQKILILAETLDVDGSSAGKANLALMESLRKSGFKIRTYHFSHVALQIQGSETFLIKEKKFDLYYVLSRSQRVFQRFFGKNWSKPLENRFGFSFTFKNDVNSMISALRKEDPEDYDLVITLSKGASYRTHAAILKLPKWHKKWLAYVHDPYPFHWYPSPYEWFEAGFQQKEDFFIEVAKQAKWLGYPSQKLSEWMGGFDKNFKEKAVILPHQVSTRELKITNQLPEYFNPEKFNVLHAGNLLKQRDPFPLIEAWQLFLKKYPQAEKRSQLSLLGPANYHEPKLAEVCKSIATVYRSDGYVSYDKVQAMERRTSANIVLEAGSEISPFLPAKFPGLVQANRKILHLGPKNSETRRLLGENYSFAAEADEVEKIAKKLINLYKIWLENPERLMLNRNDLNEYFSAENLGKTIENLLKKPKI